MLPFSNPVSTAFCAQALALWDDHKARPVALLAGATDLTSRPPSVRILFGSASPKLIGETLVRMRSVAPELPIVVNLRICARRR